STTRATVSGSAFSASDVNPTTSANSTVASLRSSWVAAGAGGGVASSPARDAPHSPQKRKPSGLTKPHDGHPAASPAPHWPQNLNPAGFSVPHVPQSADAMAGLSRRAGDGNGQGSVSAAPDHDGTAGARAPRLPVPGLASPRDRAAGERARLRAPSPP